MRYAIIMAGGIGSRFWPLSTQQYPKQFHDLLHSGQSLIQSTYTRIKKLVPTEHIYVVTNHQYKGQVIEHLPELTAKQLILEPEKRNTAPCILYATLKINALDPEASIFVAPCDHWIENEDAFVESISKAFDTCEHQNNLLTLGIRPTKPHTGYGYIRYNEGQQAIKTVKSFTEKPDLKTAKSFLQSGNYLWNSGMFVWKALTVAEAFKSHMPEMYALFTSKSGVWNSPEEVSFIKKIYPEAENISIDFAIMEKAQNVVTLPVNFDWSDLGTWSSLYEKLPKDKNDNAVVRGTVVFKNSKGNIIKTKEDKQVVIHNTNNCIIVDKDTALLICPLAEEQNIKPPFEN